MQNRRIQQEFSHQRQIRKRPMRKRMGVVNRKYEAIRRHVYVYCFVSVTYCLLEQVVVTNTIPLREAAQKLPKIKVLSIAGLLGAAIESIHMETSVSTLFN